MSNPDHKVAMHQLVSARKKAGLPVWAYHIRIKHLLDYDDPTDETAIEIAGKLESILRKHLPEKLFNDNDDDYNEDLVEVCEFLHDIANRQCDNSLDDFNNALTILYDFADYNRIWLG